MSGDLVAQVKAWNARATYHKQQVAHHRREARTCREHQAKIEAQCRALGIQIVHTRGGEIHGGPAEPDHAYRTADNRN